MRLGTKKRSRQPLKRCAKQTPTTKPTARKQEEPHGMTDFRSTPHLTGKDTTEA